MLKILFWILVIFSFIVLSLFIQLRDFEDNDIPYGCFIIFCIVNFFLLNNGRYTHPILSYYIFTLFYFVAFIGILAIILNILSSNVEHPFVYLLTVHYIEIITALFCALCMVYAIVKIIIFRLYYTW